MSTLNLYPTTKSAASTTQNATGTAFPGDKFGLDVSIAGGTSTIEGSVHIASPTGPFNVSGATVGLAAANPIPTPLANRVSVSIKNKSTSATVYFGHAITVTADDTATGGWDIEPGGDLNIELDVANVFYLVSNEANTKIKIFQIASTS